MKTGHWDETVDGVLTESALISKLESLGYSCTQYVYPPGTVFPEHDHAVDKIDAVLSGKFKITMQGNSVILQEGDYVYVPKGCIHRAEVIGKNPVISIDGIKYD